MVVAAMNADFKYAIGLAFCLMLVPMAWYSIWGKNLPRLDAHCDRFEQLLKEQRQS